MKKRVAKILIAAGIACVVFAVSLFAYNNVVSSNAAKFAREVVSELQNNTGGGNDEEHGEELESVMIKERDFIGYISIPALGLNLPVMAEWSYDNLDVSPCRYSGSPESNDFVIAAHNYNSHFGFISRLNTGEHVTFTDVRGKQYNYRIELIDTLSPTAVEEMISGGYDLTLFTCTYSGEARVTVRLNKG